ncbi:MAG: acryloyl-CoA reductase [Betaproteobacteria bacterium]|nr:acryloyl-CoA reductase [Betaproteobacteria bacterium]
MRFRAVKVFHEDGRRAGRMVTQSIDDLDPGEVLIKSKYAAVNFKDARAVCGVGNVVKRFPCIPGVEVSGAVAASTSPAFREGDMVTVQGGQEFGIRHDGAYGEYVRVPAAWVERVPEGMDAFEAVALGLAAYTSAVAVEELIRLGVTPDKGPIAVTGATGGCSSFAIDILAGLGYRVVASTGKPDETDYLKAIGAAEVIGRDAIATGPKPLEEQRWAGAIDAVGGAPLDALLRTMKKHGVVCAFGNAAGETFTTSIYPFILRSVSLAGINGNHPVPARGSAWKRMAPGGDLRPRHTDKIAYAIALDELQAHCDKLIRGGVRGRAVVRMSG